MDPHLISDRELLSRLQRSARQNRQHCEQGWKAIYEAHVLLGRIAVLASASISRPTDRLD